jgi:hypothetical protein
MNKKVIPLLLSPLLAFSQIEPDKQKHYLIGAGIGATAYTLTYKKTKNKSKAVIASLVSSYGIGTIKEVLDSQERSNRFDSGDLLMTGMGGASFCITVELFANKKPRRFR